MSKFKLFLVIAGILIVSGCVSQKKCNAKFPPSNNTQVHDSIVIKDSIIYKDRLVPYKIAGDTIWQETPIPGIPEKINTSPIFIENAFAKATAWIENSILKMQLEQKDQVIMFKLDSADKVSKHWESLYNSQKQTITLPPEKFIPKIYKNALSICIFIFASAFIFLGWKAYTFFKK